jgi:hypothetical protein
MIKLFRNKNILLMSLFFSLLLTSSLVNSPYSVSGEQFKILPETNQPIIDGNITNEEWLDAVKFESNLDAKPVSVFVSSNASNLNFALNFTTTDFVPINLTMPVDENGTIIEGIDPAIEYPHDWMALQIDRKLDGTNFGTPDSPHDALVINQYTNTSVDSHTNSTSHPFTADVDVSGSNDGYANFTIDGDHIMYEFTKSMNSGDDAGFDINFEHLKILRFRFLAWFNQSANATLAESTPTDWFTVQLNETGTGFSLARSVSETPILIDISGFPDQEAISLELIGNFSGYNVQYRKADQALSISSNDTYVLLVGPNGISSTDLTIIENHMKLGGTAFFMLTDLNTQASNNLAQKLNVDFVGRSIVSPVTNDTIALNNFGNVPFFTGNSLVTDQEITELTVSANALRKSNLIGDDKVPYIFSQYYRTYELFGAESSWKIDANNNNAYDEDDDEFDGNYTIGLAIDLEFGGRAILTTFNPLSSQFILDGSNIPFFLRALTWVTKETHALQLNDIIIDQKNYHVNDVLNLKLNISDIFDTDLGDDLELTLTVKRAGNSVQSSNMIYTANNEYTSNLSFEKDGFQTIQIIGYSSGYGFIKVDDINVFVERLPTLYNDWRDIHPFVMIISVISIIPVTILLFTKLRKLQK